MNEEDTALTSVEAGTEEESLQNLGEVQSPQHAQKRSLDQLKTRTVIRGSKAPEIPLFVRKNWLVHLHYIRKDFETCKILIRELLLETNGLCEYAVYVQGLILRQEGSIQDSLEHFQRAVRLNPHNPANIKQVARSLFLLGQYKAALDAYVEVESLQPNDWEVLHNKGVCYIHLKEYEKALGLLSQALQISPQTITYTQLGRVYLLLEDIPKATDIYRRAVKHYPEDSELLATLGLLQLEMGASQKAFECLGSALTFDPTNYKAILAAGSIIQLHADYDVALSKYRIAAQTSSESPYLWNNIGLCFYGKKKLVAAISCLKRANYLAPFEWKILYNLGLVHLAMFQYASAFHFLRAGQRLQPRNSDILMLLGVTLAHLQDTDNSLKAYEQAIEINNDNPLVHLNYAIALYNVNKPTAAAKQFVLFQTKSRASTKQHTDPEVQEVSLRLGAVLQIGEQKVESKASEIKRKKKGHSEKEETQATSIEEEEAIYNTIVRQNGRKVTVKISASKLDDKTVADS